MLGGAFACARVSCRTGSCSTARLLPCDICIPAAERWIIMEPRRLDSRVLLLRGQRVVVVSLFFSCEFTDHAPVIPVGCVGLWESWGLGVGRESEVLLELA